MGWGSGDPMFPGFPDKCGNAVPYITKCKECWSFDVVCLSAGTRIKGGIAPWIFYRVSPKYCTFCFVNFCYVNSEKIVWKLCPLMCKSILEIIKTNCTIFLRHPVLADNNSYSKSAPCKFWNPHNLIFGQSINLQNFYPYIQNIYWPALKHPIYYTSWK